MRGVRVGEASNPGPQLSRQRSPSQGSTEESVMPASEELIDAMQEDFEGTQVRKRTRRRVLGDDDLPLTQVLLFFPTRRLEGWRWSQGLQVILLVQVQTGVTVVRMVTQPRSHTMKRHSSCVDEFTSHQCRRCFGARFVSACI